VKTSLKIIFLGSGKRVPGEVASHLARSGFDIATAWSVDNELEYQAALAGAVDLIVVNARTCRLEVREIVAAAREAAGEPLVVFVVDRPDGPATAEYFRQGADDVWFAAKLEETPRSLDAALQRRNLRRAERATEAARQESDRSHRQVFENHPLAMWICAVGDDTILAVNNTALLRYGYTREEFLQFNLQSLRTRRAQAGSGGDANRPAPMRLEVEFPGVETCYHRRKDGSVFAAELFRSPIRFNNAPATLVVARDITPWEDLLEEFRDLEHRQKLLVEQLPAVVYTFSVDHNGPSLRLSPQLEKMLGFAPEEWSAEPNLWGQHIHPADRARASANDERERRPGEVVKNTYRMFTRDGRTVWVLDQSLNVRHLRSGLRLSVGLMFDITELKQHESASRLFAHVAESVAEPVLVLGGDVEHGELTPLYANPAFRRLTGLTDGELSAGTLAPVLAAEDARIELENLRRHLQFRHHFSGPLCVRRADGASQVCDWRITAVRDEHNEITHYVAIVQPQTIHANVPPAESDTAVSPVPETAAQELAEAAA
jgi:PAS domain S-box-containing protein